MKESDFWLIPHIPRSQLLALVKKHKAADAKKLAEEESKRYAE